MADDDDAFDPGPTEAYTLTTSQERTAAESDGDEETATGEARSSPSVSGDDDTAVRPGSHREVGTALLPGHAVGRDGVASTPDIASLEASKFLTRGGTLSSPFSPAFSPPPGPSTLEAAAGPDELPAPPPRRSLWPFLTGLLLVGGSIAGGAFLYARSLPQEVAALPPPTAPPADALPDLSSAAAVELAAPPEVPGAEPAHDAVDEGDDDDEPTKRRGKRRPRRGKSADRRTAPARTREAPPPRAREPVIASSAGTLVGLGGFKDSSGGLVSGLDRQLERLLRGQLGRARGLRVTPGRVQKGYVVDAWVQSVRKKKVAGGNLVEVSCSATLSEQPGGGVKLNTRATAGAGVEEALTPPLVEELAKEALTACVSSMARDLERFARRHSPR